MRERVATFLLLLALPFILFNSHATSYEVFISGYFLYLFFCSRFFLLLLFSLPSSSSYSYIFGRFICASQLVFGSFKWFALFPPYIEIETGKKASIGSAHFVEDGKNCGRRSVYGRFHVIEQQSCKENTEDTWITAKPKRKKNYFNTKRTIPSGRRPQLLNMRES